MLLLFRRMRRLGVRIKGECLILMCLSGAVLLVFSFVEYKRNQHHYRRKQDPPFLLHLPSASNGSVIIQRSIPPDIAKYLHVVELDAARNYVEEIPNNCKGPLNTKPEIILCLPPKSCNDKPKHGSKLSEEYYADEEFDIPELPNIQQQSRLSLQVLSFIHKSFDTKDLVFIEIGAGTGYLSLLVAKSGIPVIIIEPSKLNIDLIKSSLLYNDIAPSQVTLVQNAVFEKRGEVQPLSVSNCSTFNTIVFKSLPRTSRQGESFPAVFMDDLLPLVNYTRVVMAVDTLGAEPGVFSQASKFFKVLRVEAVFMKWNTCRDEFVKKKHYQNTLRLKKMRKFFAVRDYRPYKRFAAKAQNVPLDHNQWHDWPDNIVWLKY